MKIGKIVGMVGMATAMAFVSGCGQVDSGEAGFFVRWGEIISKKPLDEGLHFYEPFGTDLVTYDIKNQTMKVNTEVFTKDLQSMKLQMSVTFNLNPEKVIALHRTTGKRYFEVLIQPTTLNAAKDVLGKMEAGEIVEKREIATKAIHDTIGTKLSEYGINVALVNITDLDYSNAYEKAVEEKQVAQQNAMREKNETLRIKEQAEQQIVRAKAEAEQKVINSEAEAKAILVKAESEAKAIEMKNKALASSNSLIEYTIAQNWDGKLPTQMLGNAPVPFINLEKVGGNKVEGKVK